MTQQKMQLSDEKFQEIYTDFKLRNQVAFAHQFASKEGKILGRQTCSYPITYIVTDEQIAEAQKELKKWKEFTFQKHENDLLFVSMGMSYSPRYEDDVCNHRVRTEFLNRKGKRYFIEFGTGRITGELRIDHAIDRDLEIEINKSRLSGQPYNNYKNLERMGKDLGKYTKENLLQIVNEYFDCKFKNIIIDEFNISTHDKDIICKSPA